MAAKAEAIAAHFFLPSSVRRPVPAGDACTARELCERAASLSSVPASHLLVFESAPLDSRSALHAGASYHVAVGQPPDPSSLQQQPPAFYGSLHSLYSDQKVLDQQAQQMEAASRLER